MYPQTKRQATKKMFFRRDLSRNRNIHIKYQDTEAEKEKDRVFKLFLIIALPQKCKEYK